MIVAVAALPARGASGQDRPVAPPAPAPAASPAAPAAEEIAEEFTLGTLPTLAGPGRGGWSFRVTHRFARDLGRGGLGDLAADLFGFDNGALVGLEFRYGFGARTQAGLYRTSDRTIELFAQHRLLEPVGRRYGLSLRGGVEGADNFSEDHGAAVALVGRYDLTRRASLYLVPAFHSNVTRPAGLTGSEDEWILLAGFGARLRPSETFSVFAEYTPRLAGFAPDGGHEGLISFGVEKQVGGGGHAFQLSVSNEIASTSGQRALGRITGEAWYIGFNLSRKFY